MDPIDVNRALIAGLFGALVLLRGPFKGKNAVAKNFATAAGVAVFSYKFVVKRRESAN